MKVTCRLVVGFTWSTDSLAAVCLVTSSLISHFAQTSSCSVPSKSINFSPAPSPPQLGLFLLMAGQEEGAGGRSVGVVHDGLDIVAWEEARGAVHHALKPAVVVLLDHVDDGALLEGQLVLLVARVVVDGDHCWEGEQAENQSTIHRQQSWPPSFLLEVLGSL